MTVSIYVTCVGEGGWFSGAGFRVFVFRKFVFSFSEGTFSGRGQALNPKP